MRAILRAQCAGHDCRVSFPVSAASEQGLHDALTEHAEYRLYLSRSGFERGPVMPRIHPDTFTNTNPSLFFWNRVS